MLSAGTLSSAQPSSPVRQDWFMMTGDLIINLTSEKAGEPRIKPARLSTGNKFQFTDDVHQPAAAAAAIEQPQPQTQLTVEQTTQTEQQTAELQRRPEQPQQKTELSTKPEAELSGVAAEKETFNHNNNNNNNNKHSTISRSAASNASSGVADLDDDEPISSSNSSTPEPENLSKNNNNNNNNNNVDNVNREYYNCDHQPAYENVRELKRRIGHNETTTVQTMNSTADCDYVMSRSFDFIDSHPIHDQYERIAHDLYHLNGYDKTQISQHLSKNNDYSRRVAAAYLRYFDFTAMKLDEALRLFLSRFFLNGETYEQERVLIYFSKRYHDCNLNTNFASTDSIHTLVCALMILNTDLHEDVVLRKMSCADFIANLAGLNEGDNYSAELLKYLYYSVKSRPLGWNDELSSPARSPKSVCVSSHAEVGVSPGRAVAGGRAGSMFSKMTTISRSIPASVTAGAAGIGASGSASANMSRKFPSSRTIDSSMTNATSNTSPFVLLPNPAVAIEYKRGYIRRKRCRDSDAKRTSKGKRSWRMFYATLRDLVLYLHHDESKRHTTGIEEFEDSIRIHHAIASSADDYHKRQFVFRLITADQAEYLFETSDSRELQSWINVINTTAASLSAPPLPLPVGSSPAKINLGKRRPLPMSHTKLSQGEQLRDQENKLLSLQKDLEEVHGELSKAKLSSSLQRSLVERERFLGHEASRYRVYISCLKMKALAGSTSLVSAASNTDVVINNDDGTSSSSSSSSMSHRMKFS